MTRAVVFQTPGHIDIRAFTVLGVNAKPESKSPIGYFGTGLKYAIAVLVREGFKPVVWIGTKKYTFFPKVSKFRDKEFTFIRMKLETYGLGDTLRGHAHYHDLPFTTEFGKNWELWQGFRELETNTRDENGVTFLLSSQDAKDPPYDKSCTTIIVEGEPFVEEFLTKEKTFLSDSLVVAWENDRLQIYDRPSDGVYYRGIRVMNLEKPSKLTYNILTQTTLTEDRTIAYPHIVEQEVAKYAAHSEDGSLIKRIVEKDDEHWEGSLRWAYIYDSPGKKFLQVMSSRSGRWTASPSAGSYYRGYAPKPKKVDPLMAFPTPWEVLTDCGGNHEDERFNRMIDSRGKAIFDSLNSDHREMDFESDEHGGTWKDTGTFGLFNHIAELVNKSTEDF